MLPTVGGLLSKVAEATLSDRQQRLGKCVSYLIISLVKDGILPRSDNLELREIEQVGYTAENISTLIEGARKAKSEESLKHIVYILRNGIEKHREDDQFYKRLIRIRSRISDGAFIVLCRLHPEFASNHEFYDLHKGILDGRTVHSESSSDDLAKHHRFKSYAAELRSEGLCEAAYGFGVSTASEADSQITHLGAELLRFCGVVSTNAVIPLAMSEFTIRVLERYEALRDSAGAVNLQIAPYFYCFLGFHSQAEPHYQEYCNSLFQNGKFSSQRPSATYSELANSIGPMARIYQDTLEKFSDFQADRDYRVDPLSEHRIRSAVSTQHDALVKIGIDPED